MPISKVKDPQVTNPENSPTVLLKSRFVLF